MTQQNLWPLESTKYHKCAAVPEGKHYSQTNIYHTFLDTTTDYYYYKCLTLTGIKYSQQLLQKDYLLFKSWWMWEQFDWYSNIRVAASNTSVFIHHTVTLPFNTTVSTVCSLSVWVALTIVSQKIYKKYSKFVTVFCPHNRFQSYLGYSVNTQIHSTLMQYGHTFTWSFFDSSLSYSTITLYCHSIMN